MRLSWSGKLFLAAIGTRLLANQLRTVADSIGTDYSVTCPHCSTRCTVPGNGRYDCPSCSGSFNVN